MKTIHYLACGLVLITLFSNPKIFGQPATCKEHKEMNFHQGESMIPNLTEEQRTKIKDLHLTYFKEVKPLKNQLGELRAKERSLTTADKADIKAINVNIDEITKVLGQIMKSKAQLNQQIRSLLTDEQRVYFDMHGMKNMKHEGMLEERRFGGMHHEKDDAEHDSLMPQME